MFAEINKNIMGKLVYGNLEWVDESKSSVMFKETEEKEARFILHYTPKKKTIFTRIRDFFFKRTKRVIGIDSYKK